MSRARILIVEDEQIVALDIQGTLESCGYTIVGQTHRGDEAIKKAANLNPDLIMMDIGLKGEMDGIEAAKQIRSRFDLPVIFLTAFANLPTIERARKAEPYGYIIKPFEERDLVINIEMALYKHGMERKLRESESKFHNVIEHASDGIILNDSRGNIIEWNRAMEKISGLMRGEVIGKPSSDVTFRLWPKEKKSTELKEKNKDAWEQAIQNGYANPDQMAEREIENLQGTHRIIQSNGFVIETKQEKFGGVIIRDITESKHAEYALRMAEADYRAIFEKAPVGIFRSTVEGQFVKVNRVMAEMYGYSSPEEMILNVKSIAAQIYVEPMLRQRFKDLLAENEEIMGFESLDCRKDGSTFWTSINARAVKNSAGEVLYYEGFATDITERKQAEIEIIAAKNQLKSTLDAIPDLLFEVGLDGRYYSFHSPQQDLLFASPDAFLGKTVSEVMPNDVAITVMEAIKEAHEKGRSNGKQFELQVPYGRQWFELSISPKNTSPGEEPRFIVLSRDITDRKLLQQAEHEQRQLAESLRDTSTALNSTLKLDEVLDRVLDNIKKLVSCDAAMVLLIEGHTVRKILHRSNTPVKSTNQPQVIGNTIANLINVPILDEIVETRQPCLIPDTQTDSRWRTIPGMGWIRSFISAPVQIRGHVAGLINVISTEPRFFTPLQSERLMAFAGQVAVAIENAQLFEQAQILAMTDPLTEMNNRRYFFDIARTEFERIQRTKRTLSIMMVDIDRFKAINDTYGHVVGDLVLREIAARIKSSVRTVDIVARYGGEEFIVLMPETDLDKACQAAERMRKSVGENPIEEEDVKVTATLSIGVAEIDEESKNVDQLIVYADQALFNAKLAGRNRVAGFQKT